ncbi:signal transduction histidine kinase/CheY-like chemotaxis protein [Lewinella aquimaris]|uniref:histidine kinase n=1 Tax=Neolewinella aquimaris TaxID=1835722 RepID=A0A840E843_9BACT|nr:ATP-binding protein [Neolewinella aquimaris]MBB4077959.1 signal transduction histidine kinase/CheY-like chemotaxis protein [Neolewinella aquimaris]
MAFPRVNIILWILLLLGCSGAVLAGPSRDSTVLAVLPRDTDSKSVLIQGKMLIDTAGWKTIHDVLALPDSARQWHVTDGKRIDLRDYYTWVKFRLKNDGPTPKNVLLRLHHDADSIGLYRVVGEAITESKQWTRGDWSHRPYVTFAPNVFSVGLGGGEEIDLYVRLFEAYGWPADDVASARLIPERAAVNAHIRSVAWHSIYIGLMLAIAALGVVTYGLFRERAFLWFAMLTVCFAFYFADENQVTSLIGIGSPTGNGFGLIQYTISGLIISLTFFLIAFTDLRNFWPRYTNFLLVIVAAAVAAQFLFDVSRLHIATSVLIANGMTLVWIVFTAAPVFLLARRGSHPAGRLLMGTAMLLVPAVIYVGQLLIYGKYSPWAQIIFEIGTLGFSTLLFFGLYSKVNDIRIRAQTLTEQSQLKSRFFANISHEFRTPLTLIMGPLEQLLKQFSAPSPEHKLLKLALRNAQRQLRLVNRILELSRLEATEDNVDVEVIDLCKLVRQTTNSFSHLAEQQGIDLHFVGKGQQLLMSVDKQKLEDAVNNLLSNALKFTGAGGRVTVTVKEAGGEAIIEVVDTGVGIPKEMVGGVFNRFFQGAASLHTTVEGSGIGLSLVRETVRLHGGKVAVESEYGRGSTFTISLPFTPNQQGVIKVTQSSEGKGRAGEADAEITALASPPDGPRVLLVEDNEELRQLIRFVLADTYRVAEAANGADGIAKAIDWQPDLIITDVMMPVMDGYELCKTLKSTLATSHIPIIVLTARASSTARIDGYETGADDFLTKPFNNRELLVRVNNLIQSRIMLRQRFATAIELKPREVATSPVDSEFLERATTILEQHISDEAFKVPDFARVIGMSSTSLNRKLRGLLGQSTNQFMQMYRLQRAADMLRVGDQTVAEIAIQTGFSSSTYFVKLFKDKFGVTPGSFEKSANRSDGVPGWEEG